MRLLNQKIIFIHIPRCGGTSINDALVRSGYTLNAELDYRKIDLVHLYGKIEYNSKTVELDHCTYEHMNIFCSQYEMENFIKFAIVRDPIDRIVSVYNRAFVESDFRILGNRDNSTFTKFVDGLEWLWNEGFFELKEILKLPHANLSHYLPQAVYVCNFEGSIAVDNLISINNLESGVNRILSSVGLAPISFPSSNRSKGDKMVTQGEIEENRSRLEKIYSLDCDLMLDVKGG